LRANKTLIFESPFLSGGHLKLKEILVHKPGKELNIVTKPSRWLFNDYFNIMEMQREHDELVKILNQEGVKTHYLRKATSSKPKLYLTRDSAVVIKRKAVTGHFVHSIRRGEEQLVKQRLRELNVKIAGHIFVPGFLHASDIFFLDKDRVFARIGEETNEEGIEHLSNIMNLDITPIHLLKFSNTQLNFINNSVVMGEDLFDTEIYNLMKELKLDMITAKRQHVEEMAVNFLQIDDNKIVNVRSDFNNKLRMIGYDVIEVNVEQLTKGRCGIRNMCLPFH
jgi:N-dimethylarginine dimethylaminohydrolase